MNSSEIKDDPSSQICPFLSCVFGVPPCLEPPDHPLPDWSNGRSPFVPAWAGRGGYGVALRVNFFSSPPPSLPAVTPHCSPTPPLRRMGRVAAAWTISCGQPRRPPPLAHISRNFFMVRMFVPDICKLCFVKRSPFSPTSPRVGFSFSFLFCYGIGMRELNHAAAWKSG